MKLRSSQISRTDRKSTFTAPLNLGWYDLSVLGLVVVSGVGAAVRLIGG